MKRSPSKASVSAPGRAPALARRALLVTVTLAALPWIQGCATNEENLSERPWNTPRSWETGLPSSMTEERR